MAAGRAAGSGGRGGLLVRPSDGGGGAEGGAGGGEAAAGGGCGERERQLKKIFLAFRPRADSHLPFTRFLSSARPDLRIDLLWTTFATEGARLRGLTFAHCCGPVGALITYAGTARGAYT